MVWLREPARTEGDRVDPIHVPRKYLRLLLRFSERESERAREKESVRERGGKKERERESERERKGARERERVNEKERVRERERELLLLPPRLSWTHPHRDCV